MRDGDVGFCCLYMLAAGGHGDTYIGGGNGEWRGMKKEIGGWGGLPLRFKKTFMCY